MHWQDRTERPPLAACSPNSAGIAQPVAMHCQRIPAGRNMCTAACPAGQAPSKDGGTLFGIKSHFSAWVSQHPLTRGDCRGRFCSLAWPPSMYSRASLTIRVLGISPPGALMTESLEARCREFCDDTSKPRRLCFRRRPQSRPRPLLVSVARQGESDTGTVTFPSEESKTRALDAMTQAGWQVDDTFADLTVLHSAPDPELE